MGKLCQTCGLENPDDALACANCGTSFGIDEKQTRPCVSCGSPNPLGAIACEFCGASLKKPSLTQATANGAPVSQVSQVQKPGLPPPAPIKPQPKAITPAKPVSIKKKGKSRARSIITSIFYAAFCMGFFGFLLWLVLLFFSAI